MNRNYLKPGMMIDCVKEVAEIIKGQGFEVDGDVQLQIHYAVENGVHRGSDAAVEATCGCLGRMVNEFGRSLLDPAKELSLRSYLSQGLIEEVTQKITDIAKDQGIELSEKPKSEISSIVLKYICIGSDLAVEATRNRIERMIREFGEKKSF